MIAPRPRRWAKAGIALALAATATLAWSGCQQIAGIPDRKLAENVACAGSQCVCDAGFGDCNGAPGDGCETSLDDPENCGACGHSCLGGECRDLQCRPFVMATPAHPSGPGIENGTLYYADSDTGDVLGAPARGGGDFQLVSSPGVSEPQPVFAEGDDALYLLEVPLLSERRLFRIGPAGDVTEPWPNAIGTTNDNTVSLAMTSDAAFVGDGGNLYRVDRATGARTQLSEWMTASPANIGDEAYWVEPGVMMKLPKGGAPTMVFGETSEFSLCGVAPADDAIADRDCYQPRFNVLSLDGNIEAEVPARPLAFGLHDGVVYWLDPDADALEAWDGTSARVLADGQHFVSQPDNAYRIVFDDAAVYWLADEGIQRLAL